MPRSRVDISRFLAPAGTLCLCGFMIVFGIIFGLVSLSYLPLYGRNQAADAEAHANRGLELAWAGQLASAELELQRAVELQPDNAEFLADLGTVLAMDKKFEESTNMFERSLKVDSGNLMVRRNLAANLWQLHRYAEARQDLEIILKTQPGDQQALLLLGMIAENMEDYPAAVKALASVPTLVSQQPASIAALARSYYHVGRMEKARATLDKLVTHSAGVQGILVGEQIADEMKDYDTAGRLLAAIPPGFPDAVAVAYARALLQYHTQHFDESRQTLLHLVESGQSNGQVYNVLGWCYHQQNNPKEAAGAFEKAIRLEPAEEANYLDFGTVLKAERLFGAALELARRMVSAFPDSSRAYLLKGSVELKLSQFNDAIASFTRALAVQPGSADGILGLAEAQLGTGLREQATAGFEAGMKRFPKDARFRLQYAVMLIKESEIGNVPAGARVKQLLVSALALDSSLAPAHYQLGNLALSEGHAAEAATHLEQAVKLDSESAPAHFALARAYRRLGRREEAAKQMDIYQKLEEQESKMEAPPSVAGVSQNR